MRTEYGNSIQFNQHDIEHVMQIYFWNTFDNGTRYYTPYVVNQYIHLYVTLYTTLWN